MNIIILTDRHGAARALTLSLPVLLAAGAAMVAVPVMAAVLTWSVLTSAPQPVISVESEAAWQETLADIDTEESGGESQAQLEHMTQQLARLQTRLMRLDALGERLTELADMSDGEFDFGSDPGMGGPELLNNSLKHESPDVQSVLDRLADRIDSRTQQLKLLEKLMVNRSVDSNALLDFRPVHQGHISSGFGRRSDPLTGRIAMHTGLDFAAPRGTPIFAVGAGVVTFAGRNGAYGNMVEISHGDGYKTRYAHAHTLDIKKGDLVSKGQQIATVGSTGRSTGPHLHLEVFHKGMAVNPARHIALK
ncbi:M23 family metallopeptidase [Halopseudomonas pelagia]|uniref:M23 family metallopeptidase n=1 Tax=Halopseudomonas pelagia TaxID=553151 RepID=UPI0003B6225F|nr:M23 family metallopeptidase [Halopseudomonas pelagia]